MSFKTSAAFGLAVALVVCSVSVSVAQDKESPFSSNIIGTLANPKMASELELLDEQRDNIHQLMHEFGEIRREVGEDMKADWEAAGDENGKSLAKNTIAALKKVVSKSSSR